MSSGASQPAAASVPMLQHLSVRLGSFNYGMQQQMLQGTAWKGKYKQRFGDLNCKILEDYECDCLFGCEVGSHKQGFLEEMSVGDIFQMKEDLCAIPRRFSVDATLNYLSIFNSQSMSWKPEIPHMRLLSDPVVIPLSIPELDPQLVVSIFLVSRGTATSYLVVGNLHIRTPSGSKVGKKIPLRIKLVKEALHRIENIGKITTKKPCALVLLGDINLFQLQAEELVQKTREQRLAVHKQWHVEHSVNCKGGDLMFVKGAQSHVIDIPVGASYRDRGMRNDQHDAFGVTLLLPSSAPITPRPALKPSLLESFPRVSQPADPQPREGRKMLKLSHVRASSGESMDTSELVQTSRRLSTLGHPSQPSASSGHHGGKNMQVEDEQNDSGASQPTDLATGNASLVQPTAQNPDASRTTKVSLTDSESEEGDSG